MLLDKLHDEDDDEGDESHDYESYYYHDCHRAVVAGVVIALVVVTEYVRIWEFLPVVHITR
jgi:hypothetical protein